MKRPSTPTRQQKVLLSAKRLNPQNWQVVVDNPDKLVVMSKHGFVKREIRK